MLHLVRRSARAYALCLAAFVTLLVIVSCIPESALTRRYAESADMLAEEGEYPVTWMTTSLRTEALDTFTTALSLNIAYHSCGGPLRTALAGGYYADATLNQVERLTIGCDREPNAFYARYWHGYLVVLIPLLLVFNVTQIRTLLLLSMGLLSATAIVLIGRRSRLASALSLALALMLANVWLAAVSTSCAFCFLVALGATISVVLRTVDGGEELGDDQPWGLFYFVVGAVTVYVDFLNTPIVSLGLPLATYLVLRKDAVAKASMRQILSFLATCMVSWFAGYGLLWASKWVIASIVMGREIDVIGQVVGAAAFRLGDTVGASDTHVTRLEVLRRLFSQMFPHWMKLTICGGGLSGSRQCSCAAPTTAPDWSSRCSWLPHCRWRGMSRCRIMP